MRTARTLAAILGVTGLAGLGAGAGVAQAATFVVNKTADTIPNGCTSADCTLREATIAGNAHAGADTIVLKSGKTYGLSLPSSDEDASADGDLDLTGPTTVRTTKPGRRATVDANGIDRVFDVLAASSFRDLVIREGDTTGPPFESNGAGIQAFARVDVVHCLFTDDLADAAGAAIAVRQGPGAFVSNTVMQGIGGDSAISDEGTGSLKLTGSRISGSMVTVGLQESGAGGVGVLGSKVRDTGSVGVLEDDGGSATVARSSVSDNAGYGVEEIADGNLTITRSTVGGNDAYGAVEIGNGNLAAGRSSASGNGAYGLVETADGSVSLNRVSANHNAAYGVVETDPGALTAKRLKVVGGPGYGVVETAEGTLSLARSKISGVGLYGAVETEAGSLALSRTQVLRAGNDALTETGDGNLLLVRSVVSKSQGYGAIDTGAGAMNVSRSTISLNKDTGLLHAGSGGGTVNASTVSNNTSLSTGGGIVNSLGGVLTIVNSTVANNRSNFWGGGLAVTGAGAKLQIRNSTIVRNRADADRNGTGDGGGIYVDATATAELRNSIVALNRNAPDSDAPDCFGTLVASAVNLLSDPAGCGGVTAPPDLLGNPKLAQLKANGGPTKTIALRTGSPAINASGAGATKADQRGVKHIGKRDLGAFEYKP